MRVATSLMTLYGSSAVVRMRWVSSVYTQVMLLKEGSLGTPSVRTSMLTGLGSLVFRGPSVLKDLAASSLMAFLAASSSSR